MIRLSRAQVRAIDRIAIEEYGLPGIVLMENAARSAFDAIASRFAPVAGRRFAIVCGHGNNGGDGYAIARHLDNHDAHVELFDAGPPDQPEAFENRRVAKAMGIAVHSLDDFALMATRMDVVIDALVGTGLSRPLESTVARVVEQMNCCNRQIVAIDLPSGLDCDTGLPLGEACIKADLTVTFVAEKLGFANPNARQYTGEIVVGDIGCPKEIIERVLTL